MPNINSNDTAVKASKRMLNKLREAEQEVRRQQQEEQRKRKAELEESRRFYELGMRADLIWGALASWQERGREGDGYG